MRCWWMIRETREDAVEKHRAVVKVEAVPEEEFAS